MEKKGIPQKLTTKMTTGTQQYTFRIPILLKSDLEAIADREERSLSRQIISILKKFVAEDMIVRDGRG